MPKIKDLSGRQAGPASLAEIMGQDRQGQPKRLTLKGNYEEPSLPFPRRMAWFRKVQQLAATASQNRESYPHKLMAVANVMASIGNVCRLSLDEMAARAGTCRNTAQAVIAWLEEKGALTWNRTARKHSNGRMVRSSNLYTLIENFKGLVALIARTVRAVWRDRPTALSKGNECHGMPQQVSFMDRLEAQNRLREVRERREPALQARWQAART